MSTVEINAPGKTTAASGNCRVIFAGLTVSVMYLAFGCFLSYPSTAIANINANRNPFHVNDYEQSWIGSLSYLGCSIGGLVCGSVADALGRKVSIVIGSLVCIVGFTIVSSATAVQMVYAGMLTVGISSSILNAAVSLYSSEIATEENRGYLLSLLSTCQMLGMAVVFTAGSFLPWNWLAIFVASLYAFPLLVLLFLPESPRWFLLKGNDEAAANSLRWFRVRDEDIQVEMTVVGQSLLETSNGLSSWKDLLQKNNAKPLFICSVLFFLQAFCGNYVLIVFMVKIFQLAHVDMNPNHQAIVTGLFSFFGSIVCLFLVERCGRRPLLLFSMIFTALSMGLVATFFQIHEADPEYATRYLFWLPILGLSLCSFMFSVGVAPVPWIFACELFSTKVRGNVQNVFFVLCSLFCFTVTKTFTDVRSLVNTSGAFWFYSSFGVVGAFFVSFVVKEPKHEILN